MNGVDYPTVTVDGQELTVRFSFLAQYLLSRAGVDLRKPIAATDPGYLVSRVAIFAAAVAENFPTPAEAPTAEQWAARIALSDWLHIERAMGIAMGKAAEELRKNLQVVTPPGESLAS